MPKQSLIKWVAFRNGLYEIEGIKFRFSYGYPWGFQDYEPYFDLFYSFEELKPYMTEEFK